jgi:alpha/beta superfamily hydrolase
MAEIAPELKAMVVFAEHRYYGSSWENGSWPVEQALADFADVIRWLRNEWNAPETTAVVSFGGSYGANLAMWMRVK